jgi:probable HAF family extracellular repeat protein
MSGRNRQSSRWFAFLTTCWPGSTILGADVRATPFFSYTAGQALPGPTNSDPGPYSPYGFSLSEGSYQASTAQDYFNGTSWQPVPDRGFQAVVIGPGGSSSFQWTPVAPLTGDSATWAMTLNRAGHLVGNSSTSSANSWMNIWQNSPGTDHAIYFSTQAGTVALQTLNGKSGLPMGINNSDQIVGESYTPQGTIHGFITMPGGPGIDLNSLIGNGTWYTILAGIKIDDQGQITALANGPDGLTHFLYLTPTAPIDSLFAGNNPPLTTPPSTLPPVSPPAVPELSVLLFAGIVGVCVVSKSLRIRFRD